MAIIGTEKGLKLKVIPVDDNGELLLDEYAKLLIPRTKLISVTAVSNALGTVNPIKQIVALGHNAGAKVLIDGAQSVSHIHTDIQDLDADWFVFSGHKIYGQVLAYCYVSKPGIDLIHQYESALIQHATEKLKPIPGLHIIGNAKEKAGAIFLYWMDLKQ